MTKLKDYKTEQNLKEVFDKIAEWFETLAKTENSQAGHFQKALDTMS